MTSLFVSTFFSVYGNQGMSGGGRRSEISVSVNNVVVDCTARRLATSDWLIAGAMRRNTRGDGLIRTDTSSPDPGRRRSRRRRATGGPIALCAWNINHDTACVPHCFIQLMHLRRTSHCESGLRFLWSALWHGWEYIAPWMAARSVSCRNDISVVP